MVVLAGNRATNTIHHSVSPTNRQPDKIRELLTRHTATRIKMLIYQSSPIKGIVVMNCTLEMVFTSHRGKALPLLMLKTEYSKSIAHNTMNTQARSLNKLSAAILLIMQDTHGGLMQESCNSITNTLELHLSCDNPSLCPCLPQGWISSNLNILVLSDERKCRYILYFPK